MQELTLSELCAITDHVDHAAQQSPAIDVFCSSSSWILPANEALMPPGEPWLFRGDEAFVLATRRVHRGLRCVEPLEAGWGLACPLLGPAPAVLATELAELCARRRGEWDALLLCGIPRASALLDQVVHALGARYQLRFGPVTSRHVASLEGGLDGFWARRTRNLRKSLRRAQRKAREAGIRFERCHPDDASQAEAVYARALAIEARSWKGRGGSGLVSPEMRAFYRSMIRQLAERGRQRTVFAIKDDRDLGYVLGGVLGATYRGLQFSFDDEYRELGLGNLCQLEEIESLCAEGYREYDLGTGLDYKRRWAETVRESISLIVIP